MFGEAVGSVGSSVTHLLGSIPNSPTDGYAEGFASWAGWACLPTFNGLDVKIENGKPNANARYDAKWTNFGSAHSAGVVLFTMVDGSVHGLTTAIDTPLFHSLSTMKGEETKFALGPGQHIEAERRASDVSRRRNWGPRRHPRLSPMVQPVKKRTLRRAG